MNISVMCANASPDSTKLKQRVTSSFRYSPAPCCAVPVSTSVTLKAKMLLDSVPCVFVTFYICETSLIHSMPLNHRNRFISHKYTNSPYIHTCYIYYVYIFIYTYKLYVSFFSPSFCLFSAFST